MLFNYNDPQWSKDFNCKALNDCSGRTVTDNGSKGIALLTNNALTHKDCVDLFHLGIELTAILAIASVFNKKLEKPAVMGLCTLTGLYLLGRTNN